MKLYSLLYLLRHFMTVLDATGLIRFDAQRNPPTLVKLLSPFHIEEAIIKKRSAQQLAIALQV